MNRGCIAKRLKIGPERSSMAAREVSFLFRVIDALNSFLSISIINFGKTTASSNAIVFPISLYIIGRLQFSVGLPEKLFLLPEP